MATVSAEPVPAQTTAAPILDDDSLYEVVGGLRVEKPPMGVYENGIASILIQVLGPFIRERRLGRMVSEMLFLIDSKTNLQRRPDLAFVSRDRWPLDRNLPRTGAWDLAPDLAIEVVSPSNKANQVVAKLREYFRAGVRSVWVIYPLEAQIHVWDSPAGSRVLNRTEVLDGGALLPGFQLPLAELFEPE